MRQEIIKKFINKNKSQIKAQKRVSLLIELIGKKG